MFKYRIVTRLNEYKDIVFQVQRKWLIFWVDTYWPHETIYLAKQHIIWDVEFRNKAKNFKSETFDVVIK
jgi:hypothetical protein